MCEGCPGVARHREVAPPASNTSWHPHPSLETLAVLCSNPFPPEECLCASVKASRSHSFRQELQTCAGLAWRGAGAALSLLSWHVWDLGHSQFLIPCLIQCHCCAGFWGHTEFSSQP